ncbi:OmpW family protein, partial [Acinetobacter baumannii]
VKPTGKAQPFRINTSVKENEQSKVGDIKVKTIQDNISDSNSNVVLEELIDVIGLGTDTIPAWLSGTAEIRGLSQWEAENTGLEADDV